MDLLSLLPFLLILVFFWLLIVRPARNRQRAQSQLQNQLMPGQRVMTTSGLYATVTAVEDDAVHLETSPGVTSRWAKPAVSKILPDDSADDAARDDADGAAGTTDDADDADKAARRADEPDGKPDDVSPPSA